MSTAIDITLGLAYCASVGICLSSAWQAGQEIKPPTHLNDSHSLLAGIVGLGFVPVLNTFIAAACLVWATKDFKPFNFNDS